MPDLYELEYTDTAIELLQQINDTDGQVQSKIQELKDEPSKRGEPLENELSGLHSVHAGDYRIVYGVYRSEGVVRILGAGLRHEGERDDIYNVIARRYEFY